MANPESDLQGVGAYFEYRSPNVETGQALQLIFTPEGYTPTLQRVSPRGFYRYLTKYSSRPVWRSSGVNLDAIDFQEVSSVLNEIGGFLNRATYGAYTLVEKPLLFELSKRDMSSIASRKLPPRINIKIKSLRQAYGYPDQVVPEEKEETHVS